jgi:TET-associated glycosyltransferase-like protein
VKPRYPIYVPSKGRADVCLTANLLASDGVPFWVVVEAAERSFYASRFGDDRVLVLPFSDKGSVIPARNWIKQHATELGAERHWQLDDNIRFARRWYGGKRLRCSIGVALGVCEDFTDRYENVAISGLNYTMFAHQTGKQPKDPFWLNVHVYSCTLILNSIPYEWRGRYNEDTDICLQALAGGWCTVLFNAFMIDKMRTMTMGGGNTSALYQGDGRLRMARALERLWPGVVTTERRWQRPQHVVKDQWRKFDTPLKLKPGVDLSKIEPNEYGLKLKQVAPVVKSERLRRLLEDQA